MRKKILSALMAVMLTVNLFVPAASAKSTKNNDSKNPVSWSELEKTDADAAAAVKAMQDETAETISLQDVVDFALLYSGMEESQLGKHPYDWNCMAESADLLSRIDYSNPAAAATKQDYTAVMKAVKPLYNALHADKLKPLFINGKAQPIFPYTTGAVEEGYSNEDSDIIRFFVYVESNYDTDNDGKLDLVKALVQLPRAAMEGDYKAATIYEARPYITGCTDRYNSIGTEGDYDIASMYSQPAARKAEGHATTAEVAAEADSSDWYYYNPCEDMMDYEDLEWYDYYLVRGFAVVECGGLGTLDSEGYETCGTDLEIDAFKCVIEWLHGDRVAYTDKENNIAIDADWSNGKVGMTGRSYAGTTQFGLATTGVKGLETIVPVAGIASWYEYSFMQGASNSGISYSEKLASYCAGRYLDLENGGSKLDDQYENYLNTLYQIQKELNGDYDGTGYDHWTIRDYTLNAKNIKCPALIVHGLNDENVRTKQFDLMYKAYKEAGAPVKLLLHQNGHLTPTYPAGGTETNIGDELYDDVLNKWFSHYLYGVKNGAQNMPAVTAQSNVNGSWVTYDSWETKDSVTLKSDSDEQAVITTSTSRGWYKADQCFDADTDNTVAYSMDVTKDMTIEGSVAVHFTAATEASETNNDNLKITAYLYDVSDEEFPVFNRKGSYLPNEIISTAEEGGAWVGGGLKNFDLVKYAQTNAAYKQIEYGWMDLCNPEAGYDSASATRDKRVDVDGNTYYDYTLYLQPNLYTVKAGHKLVLVILTNTSGVSADKAYTVTMDAGKTYADIPVVKTNNGKKNQYVKQFVKKNGKNKIETNIKAAKHDDL